MSSTMFENLMDSLGSDALAKISGKLGADEKSTGSALSAALPSLLGALARNSSDQTGADSLLKALQKDHDGSILNDVSGFVDRFEDGPGDGILKHLLGGKRSAVEKNIGNASGLDPAAISKLLKMAAPLVMGMLGKEQRSKGLGVQSLTALLDTEKREVEKKLPGGAGLISKLLDSDGDGNVTDDLLGAGVKALGSLFGGKK